MPRSRELAELATSYDSGGSLGFRNRIINGGMVIDQRNNGASVNVTGNVYTLDRWNGGGVNDGVLAFQRVADAPAGFTNSLKVTVSTADTSLSADQYARVGQIIEGFNVADFDGGTASAVTVTFSFQAKSSLTGTFGGYMSSGDESRIYVFQYTINAANTWEQKTVTVTLPSSGTWAKDSNAGMRVFFSLGAGSNKVNTANTWLTSYAQQASGNVNVINTLNATWQITGVQLEAGSVATPFERRDYGRELMLCQRYFESNRDAVAQDYLVGLSTTSGRKAKSTKFSVTKRGTPTVVSFDQLVTSGVITTVDTAGNPTNGIVPTNLLANVDGFLIFRDSSTAAGLSYGWTASSEL
jgi:hypothetical protein